MNRIELRWTPICKRDGRRSSATTLRRPTNPTDPVGCLLLLIGLPLLVYSAFLLYARHDTYAFLKLGSVGIVLIASATLRRAGSENRSVKLGALSRHTLKKAASRRPRQRDCSNCSLQARLRAVPVVSPTAQAGKRARSRLVPR
jgi:hypothetical protein